MSRSTTIGLVVLGVLSLLDLAGPLLTDGDKPPMVVALVGSAFGLASLVCLVYAFRGVRRGVLALAALRGLSALSAVPAFFVSDVSTPIRALAAGVIAANVVGVALIVVPDRSVASVTS